jgi:hypothetical protein
LSIGGVWASATPLLSNTAIIVSRNIKQSPVLAAEQTNPADKSNPPPMPKPGFASGNQNSHCLVGK